MIAESAPLASNSSLFHNQAMTTRQNLHTHTIWCDGSDTMEAMVRSAIAHGLTSLGFSSHAYTGFPFDVCGIKKDRIDGYFQEIERLRRKYTGKLTIYAGFELESRTLSGEPVIDPRLDYSIGSCHFFDTPQGLFAVDDTPAVFQKALDAMDGNIQALLETYFKEVASFANRSPFSIIGHFDLVTKFQEKHPFFNPEEPWYRDMALSYLEEAAGSGKIFEVNTGAISRGWRSSPYPARFLLQRLKELHAPIMISSDCHHAPDITCRFEVAEAMLRELGFTEQMELGRNGFHAVPL